MKKTRLSDITIDVDKDWQTKGITNIKQVAALMAKGDIVVRDTNILVRLAAGPVGYVLTSIGLLKIPTWAPAGGALKYYFPVFIYSSHAEAIVAVNQSIAKAITIPNPDKKYAYGDAPADMIKLLTPAPTTAKTHVVVPVDRTISKTPTVGRDIAILVDGAVSETAGGVQTDETAAARSADINDMNLCPMSGDPLGLGDKYYLGFNLPFRRVYVYTSTAGAGNWANQVYYWNGEWVAVAGEDDQTSQFMVTTTKRIDWTIPGDWVQSIIMGMNLYWIKIETVAFVNQTTKPLGAMAWACPVA
jgi:hypothetical protein